MSWKSRWMPRRLIGGSWMNDRSGQSTVEYAGVTAAFLVVTVSSGRIVSYVGGGEHAERVGASLSHAPDAVAGLLAILMY